MMGKCDIKMIICMIQTCWQTDVLDVCSYLLNVEMKVDIYLVQWNVEGSL